MSGGFPCQDISVAGKQAGIYNGSRSNLVFEQLRLLLYIQPRYAVFENVGNFRNNGLKEVLREIANVGYDAEWYTIRAKEVTGGLHERARTFIIAHRNEIGCNNGEFERKGIQRQDQPCEEDWKCLGTDTDKYLQGLQRGNNGESAGGQSKESIGLRDAGSWPEVATRFCGVDGWVPHRVDRIKCLGNTVVPQQVYPILKAIADIERGSLK
jgi:DNA (cytosine-5)-methyltransferase 1